MVTKKTPAVTVMMSFLEPNNPKWKIGSGDHIDYMERPEKFKPVTKTHDNEGFDHIDYMDDAEKSQGAFTALIDRKITPGEKSYFRQLERQTKANGSPKYYGVISFDNDFLREHNLMSGNKINHQALRNIARNGISTLVDKSHKLNNNNVYWIAAIHENTDNIHIHFQLLEYKKLEDRLTKYKDKNQIEVAAFDAMKSKIVNTICKEKLSPKISELQSLQREILLPGVTSKFSSAVADIQNLYKSLPQEKQWQYNRPKMRRYHNDINKCIDKVISSSTELSNTWNTYISELDAMSNYYKELYGEGNRRLYTEFKYSRLLDFYSRAGNALLQFMQSTQPETEYISQLEELSESAYVDTGEDHSFESNDIEFIELEEADAYLSEVKMSDETSNIQFAHTVSLGQEADIVNYDEETLDTNNANLSENQSAHTIRFEEIIDDDSSEDEFSDAEISIEGIKAYLSEEKIEPYVAWNNIYKKALRCVYGTKKSEPNQEEAIKLLTVEALRGNVLAMNTLAKMHSLSENKEVVGLSELFYKKALESYNSINTSNAWEQCYINYLAGKAYYHGLGTDKDYDVAQQCYINAGGYSAAKYALGNMYRNGIGCSKNLQAAFECYKQACSTKMPYAYYALARCYEKGEGTSPDAKLSTEYYSRAYTLLENFLSDRKKDDNLLFRLGSMLYAGKGVDADIEKAKTLLNQSAELENKNAIMLLAKIALDEHDVRRAIEMYSVLADTEGDNNQYAQYALGKIYLAEGEHYSVDKAEAFLKRSADQGNEHARYTMAKMLTNLDRVDEAIVWYELVADGAGANNQYAQYALGKIYLSEMKYDKPKAIRYLTMSARQDNEYAQYKLGKLLLSSDRKEDVKQAFEWLHKAADEHKNMFAQYALGQAYLTIDKPGKAKKYFQTALKQGNVYAANALEYLRNRGRLKPLRRSYYNHNIIKAAAEQRRAQYILNSIYDECMWHLQQLLNEFEYDNNINNDISY